MDLYRTMPSLQLFRKNGVRNRFFEFQTFSHFPFFFHSMSARQLARLRALIEEKKRIAEEAAREEEYDEEEEEYDEEYDDSNKVSFSVGSLSDL